jgi:hypothetical protein
MVNNSTNINKTIQVLCDKVCQYLAAGLWFSLGTPVSSTNKTDRHDITEILLKVVLNTVNLTHQSKYKINTIISLSQCCFSSQSWTEPLWFIKYIFDRHLQFINHVKLWQPLPIWLSCFNRPYGLLVPKTFKLFGFPTF